MSEQEQLEKVESEDSLDSNVDQLAEEDHQEESNNVEDASHKDETNTSEEEKTVAEAPKVEMLPMELRTRNLPEADKLLTSILKHRGWDRRKGQFTMAEEIGFALEDGNYDVVINAPVGIGKSLGYLVSMLPSDRHGIICTSTRALQDQLIDSELPDLARDLKELYDYDLTYQVIKGKNNYLCLDAAYRVINGEVDEDDEEMASLFGLEDGFDLAKYDMEPLNNLVREMEDRMQRAKNGEVGVTLDCGDQLANLPPNIRGSVTATKCINHGGKWWAELETDKDEDMTDDGDEVSSVLKDRGPLTPQQIIHSRTCPLGLAYVLSINSDVAVLNTSLLAAELQKSESMPYETMPTQVRGSDLVIVDEAHHLVRTITDSMRVQLDIAKTSDDVETYIRRIGKHIGGEFETHTNNLYGRYKKEFLTNVHQVISEEPEGFRGKLATILWDFKNNCSSISDRIVGQVERDFDLSFSPEAAKSKKAIGRNLSKMNEDALDAIAKAAMSLTKKSELEADDSGEYISQLSYNLSVKQDPETDDYALDLVPIDISFLRNMFEDVRETENMYLSSTDNNHFKIGVAKKTTLILCSGTITDSVAELIGIKDDDFEYINVKSPFDSYNSRIFVPNDNTFVNSNKDEWMAKSYEYIREAIRTNAGRTMVLTTSGESAAWFAALYEQDVIANVLPKYEMVWQGGGWTRKEMLDVMASNENSILFGTKGFWEGVNIPGFALSQVIIDKIPFPMKDDPAVEARRTFIKRTGGNPFTRVDVDMAAIDLEQARGRLIRSVDDIGGVIILDSRVADSRYASEVTKLFPAETLVSRDFKKYLEWMHWVNPDNGEDQEYLPSESGWKALRPKRRRR